MEVPPPPPSHPSSTPGPPPVPTPGPSASSPPTSPGSASGGGAGPRRSGFFLAAMILGIVGLVVVGILIAAAAGVLDDGDTQVFELERGECVNFDFDIVTDSEIPVEVSTVVVVECDEEHEAEVIGVGNLNPSGDRDYPSDDALFAEISATCGRGDLSRIFIVAPKEESWANDDGPFVCFELSQG